MQSYLNDQLCFTYKYNRNMEFKYCIYIWAKIREIGILRIKLKYSGY